MNSGNSSAQNPTSDEKTNEFEFAVTALATLGAIIIAVYTYFQTNAVGIFEYIFASAVIDVLIILSASLIIYILIKGFLMEVENSAIINSVKKITSFLYKISFVATIMIIVVIVIVFSLIKTENGFIASVIFSIITLIIIFLNRDKIWADKGLVLGIIFGFSSLIFIVAVFWVPLFDIVLRSPLQGHVTIDMDSTYNKNGAPIPASIQVTGPNTGLTINLSKENPSRKMTLIDSIGYLEPNHNPDYNVSDEHSNLTGNSLGNGKYNVFINTSNLSEGYYELTAVRFKYNISDTKGFYLFKASEQ